ncbi:MAG: hypothetical protein HY064_14500 [Bacteroidetes bacterium]|nr:hypothetical protein [Bacteroidota bacterium]
MRKTITASASLIFIFLCVSFHQHSAFAISGGTDSVAVQVTLINYSVKNNDTVDDKMKRMWNEKFSVNNMPDIYYAVHKTSMRIALPLSMYDPTKHDQLDVKTVKSGDPAHQGPQYDQSFTRDFDSTGRVVGYSGTGCASCTYTPFEYHYNYSASGKLNRIISVENIKIVMGGAENIVQNEIEKVKILYDASDRISEIIYSDNAQQGWKLFFKY